MIGKYSIIPPGDHYNPQAKPQSEIPFVSGIEETMVWADKLFVRHQWYPDNSGNPIVQESGFVWRRHNGSGLESFEPSLGENYGLTGYPTNIKKFWEQFSGVAQFIGRQLGGDLENRPYTNVVNNPWWSGSLLNPYDYTESGSYNLFNGMYTYGQLPYADYNTFIADGTEQNVTWNKQRVIKQFSSTGLAHVFPTVKEDVFTYTVGDITYFYDVYRTSGIVDFEQSSFDNAHSHENYSWSNTSYDDNVSSVLINDFDISGSGIIRDPIYNRIPIQAHIIPRSRHTLYGKYYYLTTSGNFSWGSAGYNFRKLFGLESENNFPVSWSGTRIYGPNIADFASKYTEHTHPFYYFYDYDLSKPYLNGTKLFVVPNSGLDTKPNIYISDFVPADLVCPGVDVSGTFKYWIAGGLGPSISDNNAGSNFGYFHFLEPSGFLGAHYKYDKVEIWSQSGINASGEFQVGPRRVVPAPIGGPLYLHVSGAQTIWKCSDYDVYQDVKNQVFVFGDPGNVVYEYNSIGTYDNLRLTDSVALNNNGVFASGYYDWDIGGEILMGIDGGEDLNGIENYPFWE